MLTPLVAWLLLAQPRPMELVFVRHSETIANATGRYNSKTLNAFSERGLKLLSQLTSKLKTRHYDAIVVSPSPRALKTVEPFLRAYPGAKAVVWPELYECCDGNSRKVKGPVYSKITYGDKIKLPANLSPLFVLPPGNDRYILSPSYEDGLRQIQATADRLKREFGGSGKTVLVVGHSLHGGRFIELLEGKPMVGKVRPANTEIMTFRENGNIFVPLPQKVTP